MRSFTPSVVRRNRSARRALHVEALEQRAMLAGNVTAQLVGSTLLLTGDSFGNELVIASVTGGQIAVIGNNTTVNGSATPFVTARSVVSIVANLNGGNDGIAFGNSAEGFSDQLEELGVGPLPDGVVTALQNAITSVAKGATRFSIPGSLAITMDGGSDFVGIIGDVGGSVAANLGSAPTDMVNGNAIMNGNSVMSGNALMIGGFHAGQDSSVGGALSVVGGAQLDAVELAVTTVGGGVAVALGNGDNFLGLYASSIASLAYTGGSGSEEVDTEDLRVRYGVSVVTGAGNDEVYLHDYKGAQTLVGGSMVVNTGADDDYVEISAAVRGAVSLATGTGDDEVRIYETSVGLNAVINTDGGDDAVEIALTQVRYNLFVYLGAGNDELSLTATRAFAAYLYGGPGTNALAIDGSSRANIRWLYYWQFQMVM